MSLVGIIAYTSDALAFALPAGLLFLLGRLVWKRGRSDWQTEGKLLLFAMYLAALVKITAIRQAGFSDLALNHSVESLQLLPLWNTLLLLEEGLWPFFYNVLGNLIWFVPLGFFLRWLYSRLTWKGCLWLAATLSTGIELFQWLLQSGISDIDDIIFNTFGALLGWYFYSAAQRIWKHGRKKI